MLSQTSLVRPLRLYHAAPIVALYCFLSLWFFFWTSNFLEDCEEFCLRFVIIFPEGTTRTENLDGLSASKGQVYIVCVSVLQKERLATLA